MLLRLQNSQCKLLSRLERRQLVLELFVFFVFAFLRFFVDFKEPVELHHRSGHAEPEGIRCGLRIDIDRGLIEDRGRDLRSHESLPDELVDLVFILLQILLDLVWMAHRRSRANGFVGSLRFLLLFVRIWRLRNVWIAILRFDVLANFRQRIIGDSGRIGSHVGDQTDGTFLTQFHAFIEPLGDHHGALHAEAQLAGGILLQLAGGERWGRIAAPFFAVNRPNQPVSFLQSGADFLRFVTIRNLNFLFALAEKTSIERWRFAGCKMRINGPVFFLFERLDLALAFDNQPQSDSLNATRR